MRTYLPQMPSHSAFQNYERFSGWEEHEPIEEQNIYNHLKNNLKKCEKKYIPLQPQHLQKIKRVRINRKIDKQNIQQPKKLPIIYSALIKKKSYSKESFLEIKSKNIFEMQQPLHVTKRMPLRMFEQLRNRKNKFIQQINFNLKESNLKLFQDNVIMKRPKIINISNRFRPDQPIKRNSCKVIQAQFTDQRFTAYRSNHSTQLKNYSPSIDFQ